MKTIAAFDFDGTLTSRDTLLYFILFSQGCSKTLQAYLKTTPTFLQYFTGAQTREQIKEKLIHLALGEIPYTELVHLGNRFATEHLDAHLIPERIERYHWHKKQGHLCVLISANLDLFTIPWGMRWGFDAVLCTELAHQNNQLTGKLAGPNCWGEEKVKRLLSWASPRVGERKDFHLWAYGNSSGDLPLLNLADYPKKY